MKKIALFTTILLQLISAVAAQQASAITDRPGQTRDEELVTKIYEIHSRRAVEMRELLAGFFQRDETMTHNQTFNALTVTARPARHALIGELIKKYDVPTKTIELQFYMLKANRMGTGIKDGVPDQIKKVIKDISSLTQYQSFELVDTPVIRASEGNEASVAGKSLFYYSIRLGRVGVTSAPDAAKPTGETKHQIRIDDLSIQFELPRTTGMEMGHEKIVYTNAGVRTDVVLADGETIVLGASQIRQDAKEAVDALISILTAKVIK